MKKESGRRRRRSRRHPRSAISPTLSAEPTTSTAEVKTTAGMTERFSIYHEVVDEEGAIIEQNPVALCEGIEHIRLWLSPDATVLDLQRGTRRSTASSGRPLHDLPPRQQPTVPDVGGREGAQASS